MNVIVRNFGKIGFIQLNYEIHSINQMSAGRESRICERNRLPIRRKIDKIISLNTFKYSLHFHVRDVDIFT